MPLHQPTLLEDLYAYASQTIHSPWFPGVAAGTLVMAGLALLTKRSLFLLSFIMIFFPPAGAVLMLLETRDWNPRWRRLYAVLAGGCGVFYLQAFRPSGLHPVDAWLLSIWAGALLAGGFFFLHWRHRFSAQEGEDKEFIDRVTSILSEKEVPVEHMLISTDGATGIGFHIGRDMAYLVRPRKSFPQEISLGDILAVLQVEDEIVLAESSVAIRLSDIPFQRDRFWPPTSAGQSPAMIERVELRIAVADALEPVLIIEFLSAPVKRGSKGHGLALAESRRWFELVDRKRLTGGNNAPIANPWDRDSHPH